MCPNSGLASVTFSTTAKRSFCFALEMSAGLPSRNRRDAPSPNYLIDFLATANGQALVKAFMRIKRAAVRRYIVRFLEAIADEGGP